MGRKQPSETKNRTTPRSSGRRNKSETGSVVPDSIKAKHVKDKDECNEAKDTDFVAEKSIRRKTTSKNSCPNTKYEQDYGDETSEILQTETSNAKGKSTRSKRKKEWEHYKNSRSNDTNDNKPVKFKPRAAVNQTCLDNESELQEQSGSTKGRKGKKYDKEIIKEEVEVVHDRLNDLHGSCFPENIQNNSRVEGKDIKTIRLKHNCKDTEKVRRKSLEKDMVLQVKQEKIENKKDTRIVSAEKKLNRNNSSDVLSILMQMEGPLVSEGYSHSVAMVQDDKMMLDSVTVETVGADTVKESENSGRKGKKRPNMSKSTEKKGKSKGDIVSEYFVKEEFDSDANTDDFLSDQTKRRKTFPTDVEGAASKQELGKKKLDQNKPQTVTKATGSRKKTESFLTKDKRKATKRKIEHDSVESESKSKQIGKGSKKLDSNDESSTASESATQSRKRKKDDRANKDKGGDSTNLSDSSTLECKLGDVTKRENKTGKSTKSGRKTVTDLPQKSTGTKKGKTVTEETKEVRRDHIPSHINKSDVMSILMHMEGPSTSKVDTDSNFMEDDEMSDTDSEEKVDKRAEQTSDDSEDDWEDVEDHHGDSPKKSQTPSKSVEITLEAPVIYKKRKKKEFDLHDYLKKRVNKYKRELALDMHKVHLLLLISRGMYLNTVCKADTLRAQVMSVVMAARELRCSTVKFHSQDHVANVLKWMNKEFQLAESKSSTKMTMEERLTCCLESRTLNGSLEFTLVCIMVLRYLGFMVRLVMSLQPIPYKEAQKTGAQKSVKAQRSSKSKGKHTTTDKKETKTLKSNKSKDEKSELQKTSDSKRKKKKASAMLEADESEHSSGKRNKRRCSKNLSKGAYREVDNVEEDNDDDLDEDFKDVDEMDSGSESEEDVKVKNRKKPAAKKSVISSQIIADKDDQNLSSDSDFEESSILIRTQPLKRESTKKKNKRVLSSDSEGSPKQDCKQNVSGNDTWLEVYIKTENKWISICSKCKEVSKPAAIRSQATAPLYYVVGIDNDNALKDVTIRYASEWLTKTRKLRVEDDWWTETLEPFCTEDKDRDKAEDKEMQAYLLQCPLPTSVSQFKGHPLYILKRHLLKYEALYPNSIVPLGFIRGEPVYSRDCCHTLHSRENWLKEGRCVRLGEEPYKYVKSRKRWNDKDSEPKECELFGKWQTEIYIPPPAVDGVIPRNAHGNVEMFQTWMLPGGTVHLKGLPALNRIARKLDIDCAPAMVGWDHHCGFAHPVMDGWIVCEEHKDILLAAWDEEQEIIQQREIEKREKRVYENWKKLIRGLLIKDRLKKRYDLEEKKGQPASEQRSEGDKEPGENTSDVPQSWPRNRLTEFKSACGVLQK